MEAGVRIALVLKFTEVSQKSRCTGTFRFSFFLRAATSISARVHITGVLIFTECAIIAPMAVAVRGTILHTALPVPTAWVRDTGVIL